MGLRDRLKKYCILKKVRDSSDNNDDSLDDKKDTTGSSLDKKEVDGSTDNKDDSADKKIDSSSDDTQNGSTEKENSK
jgi:hypothetical protein